MSNRKARQIVSNQKQDEANLPISYKQLYKFTYRTNFMLILKVSLILALFSIPFIISVVFKGIMETNIMSIADVSQEELYSRLMTFRSIYALVILIFFVVFSIGFAGALNVMKRFLTDEGVLFMRDFFDGIKKNSLQYMLITLFYGVILVGLNFVLNIPQAINYYSVLLVIFIIISVILMGMYFLTLGISMTYKVSFFRMIKNAFLMFVVKLPFVLLMLICSIIPLVVCYMIPVALVYYIAILVYIAIGFGNAALVISLFSLYIFDETVNKKQFPEIYRKGLYNQKESELIDEGFNDGTED